MIDCHSMTHNSVYTPSPSIPWELHPVIPLDHRPILQSFPTPCSHQSYQVLQIDLYTQVHRGGDQDNLTLIIVASICFNPKYFLEDDIVGFFNFRRTSLKVLQAYTLTKKMNNIIRDLRNIAIRFKTDVAILSIFRITAY